MNKPQIKNLDIHQQIITIKKMGQEIKIQKGTLGEIRVTFPYKVYMDIALQAKRIPSTMECNSLLLLHLGQEKGEGTFEDLNCRLLLQNGTKSDISRL